jgi:UDP-N-acetylglucosamine--dolichyl-phosphate N-acetylglucosaminephosphotransferase
MIWVPLVVACCCSLVLTPILAHRLRKAGIVGEGVHKPGRPATAEMGGLGLLLGFSGAVQVAVAMVTFFHAFSGMDLVVLLAGLTPVLLFGLIGSIDDLLGMRQTEGRGQWPGSLGDER